MRAALADAGIEPRRRPAGLRQLRLRRLDLRTTSALPGRRRRHARDQRQQQLLLRLLGPVFGPTGRREWRRGLRARVRLRADAARRAEVQWADRTDPLERFAAVAEEAQGTHEGVPAAAQYFGGAGQDYAARHGTSRETFAQISVKSRRHARHNPFAVFREPVTVEEVLASGDVFGPLTRLQCCPPSCGAAAVVVTSPEFASRRPGGSAPVAIRAQAMTTDTATTFDAADLTRLVGYDMTARAAAAVYEAIRRRPPRCPGRRAARLLHDERADQLRGARPHSGGNRGAVRS